MDIQGPFCNAIIISIDHAFVLRVKYSIDVFFSKYAIVF
jgi:hypothetical protein